MHLLGKRVDDLQEPDLSRFVSDGVTEGKALDFKRQLPTDQTEDKKEFLADVSSFSNTVGGHLVFGVTEAKGVATHVVGVPTADIDAAVLRIENSIRDGIQPRIPSVRTKAIPLAGGNTVLVVEVGRSWAGPHMVTYKGTSRFYARNSAGKYQLDVQEIRAAFLGAEAPLARFREFRADRIAKIIGKELGFDLRSESVTLIHVCPLGAFSMPRVLALDDMRPPGTESLLRPIHSGGWCDRVTFDGYMRYSPSSGAGSRVSGYVSVFRSGIVEATDATMLTSPYNPPTRGIPTGVYEPRIENAVSGYLKYAQQIGQEAPYIVSLALLNVKGAQMLMNGDFGDANFPIDRDHLFFPELLVEDPNQSGPALLKPLFDALWNACGFDRSLSYDLKGKWKHGK